MADSTLQRLRRLETKLDELYRIVYEMKGELKGFKQEITLIAGVVSLIITLLVNIIIGR